MSIKHNIPSASQSRKALNEFHQELQINAILYSVEVYIKDAITSGCPKVTIEFKKEIPKEVVATLKKLGYMVSVRHDRLALWIAWGYNNILDAFNNVNKFNG